MGLFGLRLVFFSACELPWGSEISWEVDVVKDWTRAGEELEAMVLGASSVSMP